MLRCTTMIDALKRFVGNVLRESRDDEQAEIEGFLSTRKEAESVTDETTPAERQKKIDDYLAAKKSGKVTSSGLVVDARNMWLIPFVPVKRSRRHVEGTFGQIAGLENDRLRFEFHPKSAWVMVAPGKAVPYVEALDRMRYQKKKLPSRFPIVVPYGVANHNPALKAAIEQGTLVKPVTLDFESRSMRAGHDDEVFALARRQMAQRAARAKKEREQVSQALADDRIEKHQQQMKQAVMTDDEKEIAALAASQGDDDTGETTKKAWDDDVDTYLYGDTAAQGDEYAGAGEWQEDFESEFERRLSGDDDETSDDDDD
jgi:hypothetical protein